MTQRHVLFLSQILPYPLDAGAKVRGYYMLRHLARRHAVTLVSFVRPTDPENAIAHLARFCESVETVPIRRSRVRDAVAFLASLVLRQPALIARDRSRAYRARVQYLCDETRFDAIHVDQIKAAQHLEGIAAATPRLIDKHNVFHEMIEQLARLSPSRVRRLLLARESRAMRAYESRVCRTYNEILAVTAYDAAQLSELIDGARPVTAIPICVDPSEIRPCTPMADTRELVYVGGMNYPPNYDAACWFLTEILPLIRREAPDVRVRLIGARSDTLRRFAAGDDRVIVPGYIDDITPYLAGATAFIVPLRAGSGMRVKIIQAMARAVPVVSTRLGALGIDAEHDRDILLADEPGEFANQTVRLLHDLPLRRRLCDNGRRLVEERYDWRRRYEEVEPVYERLFASGVVP
jgi:glycosyltransferase involved in cell wall biosynthesis